jgi:hypothetical protein
MRGGSSPPHFRDAGHDVDVAIVGAVRVADVLRQHTPVRPVQPQRLRAHVLDLDGGLVT